jgi:hypothetical protein
MHSRRLRFNSSWFVALLLGCSTPAVGAPCLPEQVPEDGFDAREAYIESGSLQCETRVCMVYQLAGDPREGCVATATRTCADPAATERSVYCTCRCDSEGASDSDCQCPTGYACSKVLEQQATAGVNGKYCVKEETVER